MKIIFLCGSLEHARDGVGDYSERLASELIKQGHKVGLLALNDQYLKQELESTRNSDSYMPLSQLRLPSIWPMKKRFNTAKAWINDFNPDWISLQFVIFAFHPKGLPFGLSRRLLNLGKEKRWHIMFHELWLGMDLKASKKNKLWGWLQMKIIRKVLADIKPLLIHTQSRLYQSQLTKLGFDSGYLPLFGNIPNLYVDISEKPSNQINSNKKIRLIHFATVHTGAPINEFAREVARYSNEMVIPISLIFIGLSGPEQDKWIDAFESQGLFVESFGELSSSRISELLSGSTVGISSTPITLAEKSGSIAAMREHGLPVICISYPWLAPKGSNFESLSGVFQYQNGIFKEIVESKKKYNDGYSALSISTKLAGCFSAQMTQASLIS